jgi:hypothetical protein
MTAEEFRHLLIAPELIVLGIADAALLAFERAFVLEHPLVHNQTSDDDPPVRRRARIVLRPPLACCATCASTAPSFATSSAKPTATTVRFDHRPLRSQAPALHLLDPATLTLRGEARRGGTQFTEYPFG